LNIFAEHWAAFELMFCTLSVIGNSAHRRRSKHDAVISLRRGTTEDRKAPKKAEKKAVSHRNTAYS
jgi:hypothetical protein